MPDLDHHDANASIEALAWAIVRRRAVTRRLTRELSSPGAMAADRESQDQYASCVADVVHEFGVCDDAIRDAQELAGVIEDLARALHPAAFEATK